MRFCSDLLGELNETFVWFLVGQPEPLPLVLAATLHAPSGGAGGGAGGGGGGTVELVVKATEAISLYNRTAGQHAQAGEW